MGLAGLEATEWTHGTGAGHSLPYAGASRIRFEGLSRHAVSSAEHLRQMVRGFPAIESHLQRIREEEHAADQLAHTALDRLDRTFITPFDREDIHELVGGLDDIIDGIDALAKR